MTAAPSVIPPTSPGSRALLGWWRELAGLRPQRLWFAHLLLHRVEALVEVSSAQPLGSFQRAVLRALSLVPTDGPSALVDLRLEPSVQEVALRDLARSGLVRSVGPCAWELTAQGRQALGEGGLVERGRERRAFYFADGLSTGGAAVYLPVSRPGAPLTPPEGWHFDLEVLRGCVRQSPEWKARHQFPVEIEAVVGGVMGQSVADWQEVIVEQAEQMLLALVQVPAESGHSLFGLTVQAEGWALQREARALALGEGWVEVLQELGAEPSAEAWRLAWQAWCGPRSLPAGEVAECKLEVSGHRLIVRAPAKLVERLRAARSDATKGEAWLLAGSGRCRAAALIELVES